MCSIEFNNSFGMNVKQNQQMQNMRFGTTVRPQFNPQLSMNTGVFTAGKPNLFASNSSQSLNFNGVQYDNKFQMLNNVSANEDKGTKDNSLKSNIKSLFKEVGSAIGSLGKDIKSLAVKGFNAIKSLFSKGDNAKSGNADKALGDIKNAQDADTLKAAVGSATQEQNQVQGQQKQGEQALKTMKGQSDKAVQAEEQAGAKVDSSNEQLSSNESKLEQAKTGYQTALDVVSDAQYAVADAENNLAAAKGAATEDNPNTAAIQQAEAQVQSAKQGEITAREKLQQAEQAQTQAQQAVDTSSQQVDAAKTEQTQAQQEADALKGKVETTETQQTEIESSSQELTDGVDEGNKKLEQIQNNPVQQAQIEENVKGTDPNQPVAPASNPVQQAQIEENVKGTDPNQPVAPTPDNKFAKQDNLIDSQNYSPEDKAKILQARQDIQNMQPGQTIQCGADTYSMDKDGTISVNKRDDGTNAGEYKDKDLAAENAGNSTMTKIDARKRDEEETTAIRSKSGAKVKPSTTKKPQAPVTTDKPVETPAPEPPKAEDKKADAPKPEIDTKTPGAKWSKTTTASGEGYSSREQVSCERNEDGTITETSVRGTRVLDQDGKKPLFEKSKTGGFNNGNLEVDYQEGTRTTDIGSMKGTMSAGYAVMINMEKDTSSNNAVLDKDGNTFVSYKDGQYYNAKGKKIDADKAMDLINKHKEDGLKYVKTIKNN